MGICASDEINIEVVDEVNKEPPFDFRAHLEKIHLKFGRNMPVLIIMTRLYKDDDCAESATKVHGSLPIDIVNTFHFTKVEPEYYNKSCKQPWYRNYDWKNERMLNPAVLLSALMDDHGYNFLSETSFKTGGYYYEAVYTLHKKKSSMKSPDAY